MKVTAKLKNLRIAPRKVRMITEMVRGKQVDEALINLEHTFRKASVNVRKLLESAIANAVNNHKLERQDLFVSEIKVGDAPRLKRWLPRAHGRATLLLKRMSHVWVTLETKDEGIAARSIAKKAAIKVAKVAAKKEASKKVTTKSKVSKAKAVK